MNSINKFLNYDDQIKNLEAKNLIFNDDESKKIFINYLREYNYSNFILSLKHKFMFDEQKKYKQEFTSNNVRYLFDIDRNISLIIWKYFKGLEYHLNTTMFKVIAEAIQAKTNTPYLCCLTEKDFDDIFDNLSNINYYEEKLVVKKKMFIHEFYKNYDTIPWFDDLADHNIDKESSEIINKIDNSWIIKNFARFFNSYKRKWVYIQIFSLCSSFSFSQLIRFFNSVSTELQKKIINEFKINITSYYKAKITEKDMNDLLNIINKMRNFLAHNSPITKFRIELKNDSKIFDIFNIRRDNDSCNKKTTLYLKDIIKIIEITRGINSDKLIQKDIIKSIQDKIDNAKKKNEISPILLDIIEDTTHLEIKNKINF